MRLRLPEHGLSMQKEACFRLHVISEGKYFLFRALSPTPRRQKVRRGSHSCLASIHLIAEPFLFKQSFVVLARVMQPLMTVYSA